MIRTVTLAPGTARAYVDGEWAGALVVLVRGRLELEARGGRRIHLRAGAVLWLAGLPLRALHNRGSRRAVLLVVTRDARNVPGTFLARARAAPAGGAGRSVPAAPTAPATPAASAAPAAPAASTKPAKGPGNAGRAPGVFESMTLPLLILFAAGTLLPCVGLWLADQRARLQDR